MLTSLNSDATGYFWRFYLKPFLITFAIVVGGLVVNSLAGCSFARLEWAGRDKLFVLVFQRYFVLSVAGSAVKG